MLLLLQRPVDAVPFRGAYFRIAPQAGQPARGSVVLADREKAGGDVTPLAMLLGLVITLGDPPAGGAPIRQHWLSEEMQLEGKMGTEISPRHAGEARRLAERIEAEWDRFLASALARLRGEERGDAHLRFFPQEGWDPEHPAARVVAWPPLPGESLPPLE